MLFTSFHNLLQAEKSKLFRLQTEPVQHYCAIRLQEDLPTYWVDMCSGDHAKGMSLEDVCWCLVAVPLPFSGPLQDVNLIKNPERNTGYNGSHIWQAWKVRTGIRAIVTYSDYSGYAFYNYIYIYILYHIHPVYRQ